MDSPYSESLQVGAGAAAHLLLLARENMLKQIERCACV